MNYLDRFLEIIVVNIQGVGYLGVFLAVFLEYACLPLPSEILLPFIGLLSSQGAFSLVGVIVISVLAGLTGSTLCYLLGYYLGSPIIDWLSAKSKGARKSFKKLDEILLKYGKQAVFFSRILPLTRTYISLLVGATKMKYTEFIGFSLGGIALWNVVLISLGYFLGENTELIQSILKDYSIIAILLILILGFIVLYKYMKSKKTKDNQGGH